MGYLYTQLGRFWEGLFMGAAAHLTLSVSGILFLGFPVSFSFAAYALAIAGKHGLPIGYAIILGVGAALCTGAIFAYLYQRLSNDSFAVVTLTSVLAADALLKSWDSVTGGVLGIAGVARPSFASTLQELIIMGALLSVVAVVTEILILQSPFGRSMRGLKESSTILAAQGVAPHRVGMRVIMIAAFLSGISGMIAIWRIRFLDPNFGGTIILMQTLTIAIIALKPKVSGMIYGTLFVILVPEILRFFAFPSTILGHVRVLLYSVLLMILIFRLIARMPSRRFI